MISHSDDVTLLNIYQYKLDSLNIKITPQQKEHSINVIQSLYIILVKSRSNPFLEATSNKQ